MASVLAIVAKKVFEADARPGGKAAAVGAVWKTDRYLSKTPGLRAVEAGGSLFLVTVRPPDERLWLVAVLESPKFDGERWTASANTVPITDITDLLPTLAFESGAGVKVEPGKVGMSLQTPRALAARDVEALRKRIAGDSPDGKNTGVGATGVATETVATETVATETVEAAKVKAKAPAKKVAKKTAAKKTEEAAAPEAAEVKAAAGKDPVASARAAAATALGPKELQTLDALALRAGKAGAQATKGFKEAAQKLGQSEGALAVLEWGIAALLAAGAGGNAATLAKLAWALEKKLGRPIDDAARLRRMAAIARAGGLEQDALGAYAKELAKRKGFDALDDVGELAVLAVGAEGAKKRKLEAGLVEELEALGRAQKRPDFATRLLTTRLLPGATDMDDRILTAYEGAIAAAVAEGGAVAEWATGAFPNIGKTRPWRAILASSGIFERLRAAGPAACVAWIERLLAWQGRRYREDDWIAWFERAVTELAPTIGDHPVGAFKGRPADIQVVDVLLAHGVKVDVPPDAAFDLWTSRADDGDRTLSFVTKEPALARLLSAAFDQKMEETNGAGSLVSITLDDAVFAADWQRWVDRLRDVAAEGTLASIDHWQHTWTAMVAPEPLAALPELTEIVKGLDAAALLSRSLRAGILDELCWPLQDQVNDGLGKDVPQFRTDGPFPYWVMDDDDGRQLIVLGPEGEVLRKPKPEGWPRGARSMRYVNGDVLYFTIEDGRYAGQWLSSPQSTFHCQIYEMWTVGVPTPEGAVWEGGYAFRAGEPVATARQCSGPPLSDGKRFWVGRDQIDPDTGAVVGASLPAWLAEVEARGGRLDLANCALHPVPASLSASPLGVKDGLYGIRTYRDASGVHRTEGIDGRVWESAEKRTAHALFRLPEREGFYAIENGFNEAVVWMPGGRHPIVPKLHASLALWWQGTAQWLPSKLWHHLVPRDLAGSRALAACTREQAEALLEAARPTESTEPETEVDNSGSLKVTITKAPEKGRGPLAEHPLLAAAIERVLPGITAPRLRAGVAGVVLRAVEIERRIAQWKQLADRPRGDGDASAKGRADHELRVVELYGRGWVNGEHAIERSIRDADRFLAEPFTPSPKRDPVLVPVTGSHKPWEELLRHAPGAVRRLLAIGTPDKQREELRQLLEIWGATGFAEAPARHRISYLRFNPPPVGLRHDVNCVGATWKRRHVLRVREWNQKGTVFAILERSDDGTFEDPPGAELLYEVKGSPRAWGKEPIARAFALLDERGPLPFDPAVARRISERTGLLYPTAALLWAGAPPWTPTRALRDALGLKKADAELAEKELPTQGLEELYDEAAPASPDALYAPLVPDAEGIAPADRFADAFVARYGHRTPLPVELVSRLEDDFHASKEPFHYDARVLEKPDGHDFLTKDERWVVRPWRGFQSAVSYMQGFIPPGWPKHASQGEEEDRPPIQAAFSGWVLRHFLRLLPWAQLELAAGDPHRLGAARIAALVRARLRNPELMLLAGAVDLSRELDPHRLAKDFAELKATFHGEPYVASQGASAPGVDRGDLVVTWPAQNPNSFFLAFRPARLDDPGALDRLAKDLGVYDVFRRTSGGCSCGLNFGRHQVVDLTDLRHYLVWAAEGFQRLASRLAEPRAKPGRFEADPRESAPRVVAEARLAKGLDENAAALWLQIAALPEPATARVRRYNGWTAATYDAAAEALLAKGLAVEGKYAGTDRSLFLPGDLAFPAAPAAPIEARKLELYGLETDAKGRLAPPFGVVLPLRPLDELFEEAWRLVR